MNAGKVVIGIILIVIAIWMLMSLENTTARYLGGGIVIIVGIFLLVKGLKRSGMKVKEPVKEVN